MIFQVPPRKHSSGKSNFKVLLKLVTHTLSRLLIVHPFFLYTQLSRVCICVWSRVRAYVCLGVLRKPGFTNGASVAEHGGFLYGFLALMFSGKLSRALWMASAFCVCPWAEDTGGGCVLPTVARVWIHASSCVRLTRSHIFCCCCCRRCPCRLPAYISNMQIQSFSLRIFFFWRGWG